MVGDLVLKVGRAMMMGEEEEGWCGVMMGGEVRWCHEGEYKVDEVYQHFSSAVESKETVCSDGAAGLLIGQLGGLGF